MARRMCVVRYFLEVTVIVSMTMVTFANQEFHCLPEMTKSTFDLQHQHGKVATDIKYIL